MEFGRFVWLQILLVFFCLCLSSTEGYKFYVGGRDGWVLNPSVNYSQWAQTNRFNINDTLHFKYKKGSDSVLVVNKDDYFSCNTQNPIQKLDGGDSDFTLDRSGPFYFISGQNGNCQKGQKLLITVLAPRNPKPPVLPPPPTSPTAPGTSPTAPIAPGPSPTAPEQPYQPPAASPPQGPGLPPAVGPVTPSPSPVITNPPPAASPGPSSSQPSPSPSPSPSTNTPTSSPVPAPESSYTPTTSPPAPPPEGLAPPSGAPGGATPAPSGTPGGTTPSPSGGPAGPTAPGTVTSPPPGSSENGALRGVTAPSFVLVSLAVVLVSVALS